jgi:NAD(P)-dependent dehydrogenase (short-subunit alcohol dehydrogenase family)
VTCGLRPSPDHQRDHVLLGGRRVDSHLTLAATDLTGHSAIVAGGAGGLGSAAARRLLDNGMHVVVFDRAAEAVRIVTKELGARSHSAVGDATDETDVVAAIDKAQTLGPLFVVVNTAGGSGRTRRTVDTDGAPHDMAAFVRTFQINTLATFNVARLTAAAMATNESDDEGQRGVLIATASIAAMEGQSGQVAYAAAKGAIVGMTLPMARDLAPLGIRVCTIAPGPIHTPAMARVVGDLEVNPALEIPFPRRMGRPSEFAELVESIVRNPYLNGEVIRLDGAHRLSL